MRHARYLAATIAAAAAFGAFVSGASANRLSLSSRNIRTTFRSLEFASELGETTRCAVTMEGSFQSAVIAKTVGALVGYVTRAAVQHPCTNGSVWARNGEANEVLGGRVAESLPWHIVYAAFEGTLPRITGLGFDLVGAGFLVRLPLFGMLCEYISGTESAVILRLRWVMIAPWIVEYVYQTDKISATPGCPRMRISGNGTPSVLGSTALISVTLI
jgi:hypothetical protein